MHIHGHHHRHNKSNEDPRALKPTLSREESIANYAKDLMGVPPNNMYGSRSRAQSPTPSGNGIYFTSKNGSFDAPTSPGHHKKGILGRLRGRNNHHTHKEKEDPATQALKKLPASSQSLQSRPSRQEISRGILSLCNPSGPGPSNSVTSRLLPCV